MPLRWTTDHLRALEERGALRWVLPFSTTTLKGGRTVAPGAQCLVFTPSGKGFSLGVVDAGDAWLELTYVGPARSREAFQELLELLGPPL